MGQGRGVMADEPPDGDAQVLLLGSQALGPFGVAFSGPLGVVHERAEVLRVSLRDSVAVRARGEAFGGELSNGREHAEPWPGVGGDDAHEAVPGERIQQVEHLVLGALGNVRCGGDRPSVDEDRQAGQQVPLRVVEEVDAPFDGGAEGALPFGEIDRAGTQRVEHVLEPSEQRIRCEQSRARRGQLDGERQTVEAPADLHNRERVVLGQGEVEADGLGSIDEQLHRGQRSELFDRRLLRERRHRQRTDRILPLGAEPQHRAARGQDLEPGTAGQEQVELRCNPDDLLEVVEHEQRRGRFEMLDQSVDGRSRSLDGRSDRGGDARQNLVGLSNRSERYEHRPAWIAVVESLTDGDRQPRLADAARAGEGDQPRFRRLEECRDGVDVGLATDQRRRRHR